MDGLELANTCHMLEISVTNNKVQNMLFKHSGLATTCHFFWFFLSPSSYISSYCPIHGSLSKALLNQKRKGRLAIGEPTKENKVVLKLDCIL